MEEYDEEYFNNIVEEEPYMTKEEEREYLELYYYSDFIDLYMKLKNIAYNYQSDLFHKKGDNADDFIEFMLDNIKLNDN